MVCEDKIYYREVLFVKIGLLLKSLNILIYVKQQGPVAQWIRAATFKLYVKINLHKNRSAFLEMKSAENSLNGEH